MNIITKHIVRFIGLLLFQVLILNQLEFGAISPYITPLVYILFVLMEPVNVRPWVLMMSAFIMGLCVDVFSNSLGMHASAAVVIAYLRPYLLQFITSRDGFEEGKELNLHNMGLTRYIYYAGALLFINHFWFFIIEVLRFSGLHIHFLKAITSSIVALLIVILLQYLFIKRVK